MSNDFIAVPLADVDPETGEAYTVVRYDKFVLQLLKGDTEQMMKIHAAVGVAGEAGELLDAVKKVHIYGQAQTPENLANIVEELGDLEFYMQAMRNLYGLNRNDILHANGVKLAKRYAKLTFSTQESIERKDKQDE
jgi:NTP pyrophosphatase (non-canonical NTP hydrolase)